MIKISMRTKNIYPLMLWIFYSSNTNLHGIFIFLFKEHTCNKMFVWACVLQLQR